MHALRALVLGVIAAGVLAYTTATLVAIAFASGGSTIDVTIGSIVLLAVDQIDRGGGTVTTLGPGLVVIALAGGVLNAVAAIVISRRARRRSR